MLPRYVTSGQFSASVECLNDLQKCILCVHNAEHILLSNSSYLMMDCVMASKISLGPWCRNSHIKAEP